MSQANPMMVPKIAKVCVNIGVGEAVAIDSSTQRMCWRWSPVLNPKGLSVRYKTVT